MSKHIDKSIFPQNPKVGDEFAVHGTPESVPPGWKASGGWINSEAIGLVYRYEGVQQTECPGPCSCTLTEDLSNKVRTLGALCDQQAEVIEAQAKEIDNHTEHIAQRLEEIRLLRIKLAEEKQAYSTLFRSAQAKAEEVEALKEQIAGTPTCVVQYEAEIDRLNARKDELATALAKRVCEAVEMKERIEALEEEREGLHEQISGLKHELVKVVDKLGKEQDALDRSGQVVQAYYSVIQSLNKVIAERDQEIEALQDDLESTSEIDEAKIESLQGQIRKRDEIIVGLRQALANSSKKRWRLFGPGTGLGGGR